LKEAEDNAQIIKKRLDEAKNKAAELTENVEMIEIDD